MSLSILTFIEISSQIREMKSRTKMKRPYGRFFLAAQLDVFI